MSNGEKQEQKVSIGAEDIATIKNFFKHFRINLTKELNKAMDEFEADKTFENQEKIKKALADVVTKDQSGLFTDKMFLPLHDASSEIAYYNQFDKDIANLLEQEKNKKDES